MKTIARIQVYYNHFRTLLYVTALLFFWDQSLASLGMHGAKTVTTSNVILNEFTTLNANATSGALSVTVGSSSLNANSRFTGNLAAGELILIIQMQGATMNTASTTSSTWGAITSYNNAGKYEFNEVSSVPNSTTINLVYPLVNSYTQSGKVQVIRVPRYTTFVISGAGSVTTQSWNGSTGGVMAVEANGNVMVNGTVNATGVGFRGGVLKQTSTCCPAGAGIAAAYATTNASSGAAKGEGIGGDTTVYDGLGGRYGRGAPANGGGGGNCHNAGGGGGSNANNGVAWNGLGNPDTIIVSTWKIAWDLESTNFHTNISSGGGRGGYSYNFKNKDPLTIAPGNTTWNGDNHSNVGGWGGRPLDNSSGTRVFMGGGGGAGDANNLTGSGGAKGGGIVFLLVGGTLTGGGTINANGATADSSSGNDAAGGAGGGGSVMIFTGGLAASGITVNAYGGKGGDQKRISNSSGEGEGPGGGGGGGYIAISNPSSLTTNISGGKHGTTNSPTFVTFLPNGATMGGSGLAVVGPPNPYSGTEPLPIQLLGFYGERKNKIIDLFWNTESEINNDYFTLERSADGLNFNSIGTVDGAGNSTTTIHYTYTDYHPLNNLNYYRLKQTDFDGAFSYSSRIAVRMTDEINPVMAWPNPASSSFNLQFNLPALNKSQTEIELYDVIGKKITGKKLSELTEVAEKVFEFDTRFLLPGIYLYHITSDRELIKTGRIEIIR